MTIKLLLTSFLLIADVFPLTSLLIKEVVCSPTKANKAKVNNLVKTVE